MEKLEVLVSLLFPIAHRNTEMRTDTHNSEEIVFAKCNELSATMPADYLEVFVCMYVCM